MEMNDNGIHFPIWGICSGHQTLMLAIGDDPDLIANFNDHEHVNEIIFLPEVKDSHMI